MLAPIAGVQAHSPAGHNGNPPQGDSRRAVELLLERLRNRGVRHLFLVPGAQIDPLVLALASQTEITPIVCAHEAGAGYMADGYARAGGHIGVVAAIGGPGAANLIPSASIARMEHSRVLYLTGNVPQHARFSGAFQAGYAEGARDTDLFATAAGVSQCVESSEALVQTVDKILDDMLNGPGHPAHLSLPYDVQAGWVSRNVGRRLRLACCDGDFATNSAAADALLPDFAGVGARIVILAGMGSNRPPELAALLRQFAERYHIPVATTQDAKGLFPDSHPLSLGSFGFAGSQMSYATLFEQPLDALLWLGCRLDERNTLCWDPRLLHASRRIVQIDAQSSTWPGRKSANIHSHDIPVEEALEILLETKGAVLESLATQIPERVQWCERLRRLPLPQVTPDGWDAETPIHPGQVVAALGDHAPPGTRLCVDSGTHRQFAARYWHAESPGEFLTSASVASMGWAIAAGIGARLAEPSRPVVVLTGDGCMQMHGNEIVTAVRYRIPIAFVVSNNAALGAVLLRQRLQSPSASELSRLPKVDWAGVAKSLGAQGMQVRRRAELSGAFAALADLTGPLVIDVTTPADCAFPEKHLVAACCVPIPADEAATSLRRAA